MKCSYYTFQKINNKGADQTAQICRLVCAFVIHIQQSQVFSHMIWASMWENLSSVVCEQQRRRHAVWSAPLFSLIGKCHIKTGFRRNFTFLTSLCSWGDWFESRFVGNPKVGFCRVAAHLIQRAISSWCSSDIESQEFRSP